MSDVGLLCIISAEANTELHEMLKCISLINMYIYTFTDLLKATSLLYDCYIQSRYIPPDNDWPPYHPKHYTIH